MGINQKSIDRQNEATRQAILEAALGVLSDHQSEPFTFAAVAQRSAVSERTVFRHFPNQQILCEALVPRVSERLDHISPPQELDGFAKYIREIYAAFESNSHLVLALLYSEAGRMVLRPERAQRLDKIRTLLRRAAPKKDAKSLQRTAATLRYLVSGTAWDFYRHQAGLSLGEATLAAIEAACLLMDEWNKP